MSTVLVIGAGLVGTFTARYLAEAGVPIVAADLDPAPDFFARFGPRLGVKLVTTDILDPAAIRLLIKAHNVDAIVLTAGLTGKACARDAKRAWEVNVDGTRTVAQSALDTEVRRIVFISSFAVYGKPTVECISETLSLQPISEYGRTKVAAEKVLANFRDKGLDVRILRPCGIYGPLRPSCLGSHSARLIESVLLHALSRREVTIQATPTTADEYLYVKDLARAITFTTLCDTKLSEFVFNVGSGQKTTVQDLRLALERVLPNVRVTLEMIDADDVCPMPPLDTGRLRQLLGWKPEYDLSAGLADYLKELRFHL